MNSVPEFTCARDLIAHYRAVRLRINGAPAPLPRPPRWLTMVRRKVPLSPPPAPPPLPRPAKLPGIASMRDAIFIVVQARTGIDRPGLCSQSRAAPFVHARCMVSWLSRQLTDASYPQIGRWMGGKDHTTIINHMRKVERLRATNPGYAKQLDEAEQQARGLVS